MKLRRKMFNLPLLLVLLVTLGSAHVSSVFACDMMSSDMGSEMAEHCCEEGLCFDIEGLEKPDFINQNCLKVSLELQPHPSMDGTHNMQKRALEVNSDVDPPAFVVHASATTELPPVASHRSLSTIPAPKAATLAVYQRTQRLRI